MAPLRNAWARTTTAISPREMQLERARTASLADGHQRAAAATAATPSRSPRIAGPSLSPATPAGRGGEKKRSTGGPRSASGGARGGRRKTKTNSRPERRERHGTRPRNHPRRRQSAFGKPPLGCNGNLPPCYFFPVSRWSILRSDQDSSMRRRGDPSGSIVAHNPQTFDRNDA